MNDVIRFACSKCSAAMKVPSTAKGKRTKCPKCGNPERVPETQLPAVVEKPRLPVKTKPAPVLEIVDDDVFAADMLKEIPPKEQTITIRETHIVSRDMPAALPEIRATSLPAVPSSPPLVPQPTTACKFCGESILPTAIKCKHCGEFLDGRQVAPHAPQVVMPQIVNNINSHNTNDAPKQDDSAGVAAAVIVWLVVVPIILLAWLFS